MKTVLIALILLLATAASPGVSAVSYHYYSGYVQQSCFLGICSSPSVSGISGSIQVFAPGFMITNTVAFWVGIGASNSWLQAGWAWGLTPDGVWHPQPLLYIDYKAFGAYGFLPLKSVGFGETHSFSIDIYYHFNPNGYRANVTVDGAVQVISTDMSTGQNQALLEAFDTTTQVQAIFSSLQYEAVTRQWYSWDGNYPIYTFPYWVSTFGPTKFVVLYESGGGGGGLKK